MFLLNLLSLTEEEITKQTDTAKIVSLASIALVLVALGMLSGFSKKQTTTRQIAFGAVSVALSFALSFIKLEMAYGGSITAASMLPIILYAFAYGPVKGLAVGLIYGLLQFIQSPYFFTPVQFLLDYVLAFSSVALAGVLRGAFKNQKAAAYTGIVLVGAARLVFHMGAGYIFYMEGWVATLPIVGDALANSAFLYTFAYNALYMIPEIIILLGVLFYIDRSKNFERLISYLK